MLEKIEQMSQRAQEAMDQKLQELNDPNTSEYQDLLHTKTAYTQLDALIQAAKDQHATVGAYILSRQLSQSEQELNAAQLLRNFFKVLEYPAVTSFDMHKTPQEMSSIDEAKIFSMFPLACMVVVCSLLPFILVTSFVPALLLFVSALPLAITYSFDKPFSMARFYQEMAGIEKVLAYTVLAMAVVPLVLISTPGVTMLMVAGELASMISTGLVFYWHSKHLQSKHENLKAATLDVRKRVHPSTVNFFKTPPLSTSTEMKEIEKTLLEIKI